MWLTETEFRGLSQGVCPGAQANNHVRYRTIASALNY